MNLPDDLEPLWVEGDRAFEDAPALFRGGSFDDIRDAYGAGNVVLAEENGRPIGFATVGFDLASSREHACVGNLVVSKDHRGRGVASTLMSEAHELARRKGARHSLMVVWNGGTLPEFYKKAGYREIGVVLTRQL